jgi:WhiB family redox-sensing transcriptional regulator
VVGTKLASQRRVNPMLLRPMVAFLDPDTKLSKNWRDDALCLRTGDPDLWFSDNSMSKAVAADICSTCPVQEQCLAWAVTSGQRFGIWGGLDLSRPEVRRAFR